MAVVSWMLAACAVPVAGGLDEPEANRIVVALDRVAIDATKESDPNVEGKFRVIVRATSAPRARRRCATRSSRAHAAGVLDALDKGALVPSRRSEHAQLVSGSPATWRARSKGSTASCRRGST